MSGRFTGFGGGAIGARSRSCRERGHGLGLFSVYTVKPVLNGISRDQNIFLLKPGFRLIKVHYLYKN